MLSSKATAALIRLKEIEEKYKTKHKQQDWNHEGDSSISSVSINLSGNLSAKSKGSSKNAPKSKLNIKMPDIRFDRKEAATSSKMSSRRLGDTTDKVDLHVVIPLKGKLQEDKKQESSSSDIATKPENSLIDSVSVGLTNLSSKSHSRSKTIRQDMIGKSVPGRKGGIKTTAKIDEGEAASAKSSEISGRQSPLNDSSSMKRSRLFKKPNNISKSYPERSESHPRSKERPFKTEVIASKKRPETVNFSQQSRHSNHTESLSDNSIIEESIDTIAGDSELISELYHVDESVAISIEDSTIISQSSGHLEAEDVSVTIVESSKHPVVEKSYTNDTFEDVSSSTERSESKLQDEEVIDKKNYDLKSEKVMDSVASELSTTEMDQKSVSYISDLAGISVNTDNVITRLIKSSSSTNSHSKEQSEYSQQQRDFGKNTSNVTSYKNASSVPELSSSEVTQTEVENNKVINKIQKESSPEMTSASKIDQQKNVREVSRGKTSDETGKRIILDRVTESTSSDSPKEFEKRSSEERIFPDAKDALKKYHRDVIEALTKRQVSSKTVREASEKTAPRNKAKLEIQDGAIITTRRTTTKPRESEKRCPSVKNQELECNRKHGTSKRSQTERAKVTNPKSVETLGNTRDCEQDETLDFDKRQMHILRKRIVELRLRQGREDFQKYLHELRDLRLESSCRQNYFSPLEFPKIAEFTDATDVESKPDDRAVPCRERVSAIRRWLRDQYTLYRDYCTMAQAINARYVPTTLEDAKKQAIKLTRLHNSMDYNVL